MMNNLKEEMIVAAQERTVRRLWILCIILVVLLTASNAMWIYYEAQFEDVSTSTQTIHTDASDGGDATGIIGDNNEVGDGKSNDNQDSD